MEAEQTPQTAKRKRPRKVSAGITRGSLAGGIAEATNLAPIPPPESLPWYALLFFNLVSIVGLSLLLKPLAVSSPQCAPVMAKALGESLSLVLLCHLFWRYFHEWIQAAKGNLRFLIVKLKLEKWLFLIADRLHPWWLSVPALWAVTLLFPLILSFFLFNSRSPLMRAELPPSIEVFRLRYVDGHEISVRPGGYVEIRSGESVEIEAAVRGCEFCRWSASLGDIQGAACVALYRTPFSGNQDTVSVLLKSPCQTQDGVTGLNVQVNRSF